MRTEFLVAARRYGRYPGTFISLVSVVTLTVGVNTTVFSLLNSVVLRPLPVTNPETLVQIAQQTQRGQNRPIPLSEVDEIRRLPAFSSVSAYIGGVLFTTETPGGIKSSGIEFVDGNYFGMLGARASRGRLFTSADSATTGAVDPVAVIGHRFWLRQFGGDPDVVGRQMRVEGRTFTIQGVTEPSHSGLRRDTAPDVTMPLGQLALLMPSAAAQPRANFVVARLNGGVALEVARAQIESVLKGPDGRDLGETLRAVIEPVGHGFSQLRNNYQGILRRLFTFAIGMWMLAIANIAALLMGSAVGRIEEIRTRLSLGASAWGIYRVTAADCLLPIGVGLLLSIPVAHWASSLIAAAMWTGLSDLTLDVTPDASLMVIVSAGAIVSSLVLSAAVTLILLRSRHSTSASRVIASPHARAGKVLQAIQVAVSVTLVLGAMQFSRAMVELHRTNLGFSTDNVLLARLAGLPGGYRDIDEASYFPELIRRVSEIPTVSAVATSDLFPAVSDEAAAMRPIRVADRQVMGLVDVVSPGFFELVGIPIVWGRDFAWTDGRTQEPVVILNRRAYEALFGSERFAEQLVEVSQGKTEVAVRTVAVVENASFGNPRATEVPAAFRPVLQEPILARSSWLEVKTTTPPLGIADRVSRVVIEMGREFPREIRTFNRHVAAMRSRESVSAALAVLFAAIGAGVALIGLYGLLSYFAAMRRREFCVRMAFGATNRSIAGGVIRQSLSVTLGGLALAAPLTFLLQAEALGFERTSIDFTSLAFAVSFVIALALIGASLPAVRSAKLNLNDVLRSE